VRSGGRGHVVEVSGGRRMAFGEACEARDTDLHSSVQCVPGAGRGTRPGSRAQ